MKKIILFSLLIIFTIVVLLISVRTELKNEFEPQVNQSNDYNGVFV